MSGDYAPFVPAFTPAAAAIVAMDPFGDGFEAGREGARFGRFRDSRHTPPESLAALAALAAPRDNVLPWTGGLEQLRHMPAPPFLAPAAWDQLVWTAIRLDEEWGRAAHDAGWDTLQLFGANPNPGAGRADRDGLALLLARWLGPIKIVSVSRDDIALQVAHGGILRWRRFDRSAAVPMWLAFGMSAGP